MRIVALSDTHERHRKLSLPDGDVLVFAGDMTVDGTLDSIRRFASWFHDIDGFDHKIVVAGNHDYAFDGNYAEMARDIVSNKNTTYLEDESVTIDGTMFHGSPWTPPFVSNGHQRMRLSETSRERIFDEIPDTCDVLITHGPPYGRGDKLDERGRIGDEILRQKVDAVDPDIHIFGHVHEQYGQFGDSSFNVSVVDERKAVTEEPIVIDYDE